MFQVRKFYLDCVTDEGTAFIGYAATLRWHAFRASHFSFLLSRPGLPLQEAASWRRDQLPDIAGDLVSWHNARLGVTGLWHGHTPRVRKTLYRQGRHTLRWLCHQPAAAVSIRIGNVTMEGKGYVEELRLSMPPWQLPIDELLWGRFVGAQSSVVWIVWHGEHELQLVLLDGQPVPCEAVDPALLRMRFAKLSLEPGRTLRAAPIASLLERAPLIGAALSKRFGATFEHKMLSPATLTGTRNETGWAIHEKVQWHAALPR